jgi:hypothetical protein
VESAEDAPTVVFCATTELTCIDAMLAVSAFPSSPLKLRLLYRLAASAPLDRPIEESSALIARLWPGLVGPDSSPLAGGICSEGVELVVAVAVAERCVGVEAPVGMLVDESVLPAPRL